MLFLGAVEIDSPLDQSRRKTPKNFLANSFRDVSLDLGSRQAGAVVQPLMYELMENDVLGLISTRPATIENDRKIRRFNPKPARCAETSVGVVQWHEPNLAAQQDFHIPHQSLNAERGGDREAHEQSLAFLHEGAL
ncbi:hypothetical protein JHN55_28235 [Streptomyces sp. MBT56]|uniref:hypothetical protein n=1 Tax=unclassified Streptomyces TaxID=2593676 RepID=UPI00190C3F5E|nr:MULTISPECIES: hypothetical protein [unclassified Streptomyces]MBK3534753.1 hypothetical protein [Streptomyces sp. MBT67]MBK3560349.1 hypothetical protein [Streptomyces sp. MBT56]MBK3600014.1 hypothetical protein [Streptomyces sp. MBT54]MBK3613269.1 hypothetical protein [Streptomyces sp. MBT98]